MAISRMLKRNLRKCLPWALQADRRWVAGPIGACSRARRREGRRHAQRGRPDRAQSLQHILSKTRASGQTDLLPVAAERHTQRQS